MTNAPSHSDNLVLVLDDDVFTAIDLSETLQAGEMQVMGPFLDLEAALIGLEQRMPDAAVIDIVMRRDDAAPPRTSEQLARVLTDMHVPILFISGYREGADMLTREYADAYFVSKPVDKGQILSGVRRMLDAANARRA